jgi:SWI/SNF-related matrix-associated actin-dependent regulator of chromatin subfamily A member 5
MVCVGSPCAFSVVPKVVDKSMLDKAHHLMQLFSLRRLKADVEVSLPPKHELKISVPLSEFQVHFYRGLLMKDVGLLKAAAAQNEASAAAAGGGGADAADDTISTLANDGEDGGPGHGDDGGGGPGQSSEWKRLQSLMMQLRKCCDHPYLFPGADPHPDTIDESIVTASNKMVLLDRLLPKLKSGGHRVLIFSQFTSMLDILGDYCKLRGFEHAR